MNIIEKIKLFFKIKSLIDYIKGNFNKGVTVMPTVKPGWQCTEFYVTVLSNIIAIVGALKGIIPAQTATIALVILNGIYTILRSLVKAPDITTVVDTIAKP